MRAYIGRSVLIGGLLVTFVVAAVGQDDNPRSEPPRTPFYGSIGSTLISMLTRNGVQKEIQLDNSASHTLLESLREIDPTHIAFRTSEEQQQQFADIKTWENETRQKSVAAVQKSLTEEQFRRYRELDAQYLGGRALLVPETAQQLELTTAQKEKLARIDRDFRLASRPGRFAADAPRRSEEQENARLEKLKADLLAVLTQPQTNQWNEMIGAPFTIPKSFGGESWRLILMAEVHKELGLSEVEGAALVQSLESVRKQVLEETNPFRLNRTPGTPADRTRQSQQIIDTVKSSLTISQWNRLQELILQDRGVESLANSEVAKELGLSPEQRDRVRETMAKYRRNRTSDPTLRAKPEESRSRQQKLQEDLLDILTPDQKKQWEAIQGAKVDQRSLRGF